MSQLKFTSTAGNTFVIADEANGDAYAKVDVQPAGLNLLDIAFAGSAGREVRITGSQHTPETSYGLAYGQGQGLGSQCVSVLYFASMAAFDTYMGTLNAFRTNPENVLGTVVDRDGSYSGMVWVAFRLIGGPKLLTRNGTDQWAVMFETAFSRYEVQ